MPEATTADSTERSPHLMAAVREKLGTPSGAPPAAQAVELVPETPETEPETPEGETGGPGVTEVAAPEAEATTEAAPEGEAAPEVEGVSVTIPTANADGSKGPAGAGEWTVEGLPQEAADAMRYHIKRSAQVDRLKQQVTETRQQAGIADFYTKQPLLAAQLIEKEKPDVAKQFVAGWMKRNWRDTTSIIAEMGLGQADERILDAESRAAKLEAEQQIADGYRTLTSATRTRDYVQGVDETVQGVLEPLRLSPEDKQDLELLIGNKISAVHQERSQAGRDPFLTPTEVLDTIQPLVGRYVSRAAAPTPGKPAAPKAQATPPATGPAISAEELQRRADRAAQLKKVAGTPAGTVRPKGFGKVKSTGHPLQDALKRMRAG